MKTIFNTVGNIIGLVVVVGIGIILILTLKQANPQNEQVPTFQSPIEQAVPAPTDTPTLTQFSSPVKPTAPYTPPLCTFSAKVSAEQPVSDSSLDKYVFSEPKPVLDYTAGLEIIRWLPGDQRLLLARIGDGRRIEVFNIESGKVKEYANGGNALGLDEVVWLEKEQTVAFSAITEANEYALYLARGNGKTEQVSTDLGSLNLAVDPDGQAVTFVSKSERARPKFLDAATKQTENVMSKGYDLPESRGPNHPYKNYRIAWNPNNKKQFVYYSNQVFYLVDAKAGNVCQIDLGNYDGYTLQIALGQWSYARWSPDGRYVAIFATVGEPGASVIKLIMIDTFTGEQKNLEIEGSGSKYTMAWGPNSRDVLVIAQNPTEDNRHNLYLVDTATGKSKQILENYTFLFTAYSGVAWSSNGKAIAIDCPLKEGTEQKQLCLVNVETK